MVWHNDTKIPKSDLIVLPGGFSYGDYLRCGSIASKSKIMQSVIDLQIQVVWLWVFVMDFKF